MAPLIALLILLGAAAVTHIVSTGNAVFKSLTAGERLSFIIAMAAIYGVVISIVQTRYSVVFNTRNYEATKAQREQSALDNKLNYDLMVVQMNRDNRIKLYAPLLAWLSGRLELFNEEVRLLFPELHGVARPLTNPERDFEDLQRRVVSFEFRAELELLGEKAIQDAVTAWKNDCHVAENLLKMLKDGDKPSGEDEIATFNKNFLGTKESLEEYGANLTSDLAHIKKLIKREIDMPKRVSDEVIGGTTGAQENENE